MDLLKVDLSEGSGMTKCKGCERIDTTTVVCAFLHSLGWRRTGPVDLDTVCCCWAAWLIARACDGETMGVFGRFSRDHRNHIVDQLQSMFALPLSTLDLGSPAGVKWGRGRVTFWHVLASPELLVGRQLLSGRDLARALSP